MGPEPCDPLDAHALARAPLRRADRGAARCGVLCAAV